MGPTVAPASTRGGQGPPTLDQTLALIQLGPAEEPGAAVAHGDQVLAADVALVVEEEEPGLALAQEAVDADVVPDGLAGGREVAVEDDLGVEQAVDPLTLRLVVDPEPARQEEIGLTGFDRDADGGAVAVEVPGAGEDVVLRHHAPGAHGARGALHGQDAIHEHQRLVGEADAGGVGVDVEA